MRQFIFVFIISMFMSGSVPSQELVRIAAVVNDNVISMLDLLARIKIAAVSSGLSDSPENRQQLMQPVLRTLIEEQLKVQEAKRQGIEVSPEELNNGMQQVEQQNGLLPGELDQWLASVEIPYEFFKRQIESQILWGKYVATRLRPRVIVSEEDITAEMNQQQASRGNPEYLISRIDLYFGDAEEPEEVYSTALRLVQQTRSGANFGAMADQFSQSRMGGAGGDIGWVREDQLRFEFVQVVPQMLVGAISNPVRTLEGVHIIHVRERREVLAPDPSRIRLHLIQITLPLPSGSSEKVSTSQFEFAHEIARDVQGCEDMSTLVEELNSSDSGDMGWVLLSDLPNLFRRSLLDLRIGFLSQPVRSEFGIHLLMICDRDDLDQGQDARDRVKARLEEAQLEALGNRLLRDLRRSAFVDLRV